MKGALLRYCGLLLVVLLYACDSSPADSGQDMVKERLVGTWLREYDEEGAHVRRILILDADGKFRETSTIVAPGGADKLESQGTGQWLFDGTNLKRHYITINGKSISAPTVPFATFEISFPSRSEFVGVDHVHNREVRYRRVAEGTEP